MTTSGQASGDAAVTTLGQALAAFRRRYASGVAAPAGRFFVDIGSLRVALPNPGFLDRHDLHHVLLGAPPDFFGEVEVSAYELRTGCPSAFVALLCVGSLGLAALVAPGRVARAWRRFAGCRGNLYGGPPLGVLLAAPVDEVARGLGLRAAAPAGGQSW